MLNTGQQLNKHQLIIPKPIATNQRGTMPLFVPISMTNNVILANQRSATPMQKARLGPATTLRIQSQVKYLSIYLNFFGLPGGAV